jgi:hypothetical protein
MQKLGNEWKVQTWLPFGNETMFLYKGRWSVLTSA